MRRMRNNNQEIRIAGSSCRQQKITENHICEALSVPHIEVKRFCFLGLSYQTKLFYYHIHYIKVIESIEWQKNLHVVYTCKISLRHIYYESWKVYSINLNGILGIQLTHFRFYIKKQKLVKNTKAHTINCSLKQKRFLVFKTPTYGISFVLPQTDASHGQQREKKAVCLVRK